MLNAGTKAPDFTLPDQNGIPVSLSDFRGKKVVLYFYPKDNTPGCTRQACAFAAAYDGFRSHDTVVIGISKDSTASHRKFAEKLRAICLFLKALVQRKIAMSKLIRSLKMVRLTIN